MAALKARRPSSRLAPSTPGWPPPARPSPAVWLAPLLLLLLSSYALGRIAWPAAGETVWQQLRAANKKPYRCVGWRQTTNCEPLGARHREADKPCWTRLAVYMSGFCECEERMVTAMVTCDHAPFTCAEECARLALARPESIQHMPEVVQCDRASDRLPSRPPVPLPAATLPTESRLRDSVLKGRAIWREIDKAFRAAGGPDVVDPGRRTQLEEDFVEEGRRLSPELVGKAQRQWKTYLEHAPSYPADMFHGRGVVICGGGLKYIVPAWVNINMLRRSGFKLPIELWFSTNAEMPTLEFRAALMELSVTCRSLEDIFSSTISASFAGYAMKAIVLILSRFEEVLFLDADNVPMVDPTFLFETPAFRSTGAMFWPDFWNVSIAPDFYTIMDIPLEDGPDRTHETGQMVLDKARAWRALLLALFFNLQRKLYYPLLTDYMGQGDKETFPLACLVLKQAMYIVPFPVGSAGRFTAGGQYMGNAMIQHQPERHAGDRQALLFLHANLAKLNLQLPHLFASYMRRWELLQEQNLSPDRVLPAESFLNATAHLGYDVERACFEFLCDLRCAPFFEEYAQQRKAKFGEEVRDIVGFRAYESGMSFGWLSTPRTWSRPRGIPRWRNDHDLVRGEDGRWHTI